MNTNIERPTSNIQRPTRPMLRYHGGKWMLAPWIISHFPKHKIYVEPYGGAGSVLLRKDPSYAEIYNELDGEIVNLFKVAREHGVKLRELLKLTPFSRLEYCQSFEISDDPIEQARRTVVRSYMGFGSNSLCRPVKSGFRCNSHMSGTTPAKDWANFPQAFDDIIYRLSGVVIENRRAEIVMRQHDRTDTLFYCDPPYLHTTRTTWAGHGARSGYAFEMSEQDHREMAKVLMSLKGKVILSGYPSELYDKQLFSDWRRVERPSLADGARKRTEVLWMNF